ncbi:MAG: hypothetical protein Kow0020_04470 [Wenzhouxiangellaceae bacterium]
MAYTTLCIGCAFAQAQPEPAATGHLHQLDLELPVKSGQRIRVVNPDGNVRIRALPDAAPLQFRATVQTLSGDRSPARIVTTEIDGGIELKLAAADDAEPLTANEDFLRADFVLGVPDRIVLEVRMDRGDFTMHQAGYPVTLRANEAQVRLRTTGRVDVETLAGHVIYQPGRAATPAGGRILTSSAPVDLLLPGPDALTVEVVSGAAATTDSLQVLQRRERDGRTIRFRGAGDAAVLNVQTDTGPVRLVVEGLR